MRSEVAQRQLEAEVLPKPGGEGEPGEAVTGTRGVEPGGQQPSSQGKPAATVAPKLKRFHGTASLNPVRVSRCQPHCGRGDRASHRVAQCDGEGFTLEIEADVPSGTPDNVVRTVTENGRTLKLTGQGFETE